MKIDYLLVFCLAWGVGNAFSQTAPSTEPAPAAPLEALTSTDEPAGEIVEIIGSSQNVEQIKEQIIQSQLQALQANGIEPEDNESIRAFVRQLDEFMSPHINWEQLKPEYVALYNSTFTPEELKEMLHFYRSPLGQKILKEWPNVLQKTSAILYARAEALSPDIKKITQEFIASTRSPSEPSPPIEESVKSTTPAISEEKPSSPEVPELNLE